MPFESARLKTRRAHNHLIALEECVKRFVQSEAYSIYSEKDTHTREHIVFLKVEKTPPVEEWAAVAGDVVHNLRSALDHIVWELSIRHSGRPTLPVTGDWKRIEFPIIRDRDYFFYAKKPIALANLGARSSGLDKIGCLDPRFQALFERLQPFRYGPRYDRHPLQVLHEVDLIDKHRALPVLVSVAVPGRATIRTTRLDEFVPVELEIVETFKPGPFEDGTPLARIKETGGIHVTRYGLKMYVEPKLGFRIKLEEGRPTMGLALLPALRRAHKRVSNVIDLFEATLATLPGA